MKTSALEDTFQRWACLGGSLISTTSSELLIVGECLKIPCSLVSVYILKKLYRKGSVRLFPSPIFAHTTGGDHIRLKKWGKVTRSFSVDGQAEKQVQRTYLLYIPILPVK